jgi:hypothetical protein
VVAVVLADILALAARVDQALPLEVTLSLAVAVVVAVAVVAPATQQVLAVELGFWELARMEQEGEMMVGIMGSLALEGLEAHLAQPPREAQRDHQLAVSTAAVAAVQR